MKTEVLKVKYKGKYTHFTVQYKEVEKVLPSVSAEMGFPQSKYVKVVFVKVEDELGFDIPLEMVNENLQGILICAVHRIRKENKQKQLN
jgi:hypothetical protein